MLRSTRILISLDGTERSALNQLAERERRDPRDQAAVLVRRELEREGLIRSVPVVVESRADCQEAIATVGGAGANPG